MSTTLVKDVRPVFPDHVGPLGWVTIRDGRFEQFGTGPIWPGRFDTVLDGGGDLMMPGLIDTHVHFRDPGFPDLTNVEAESTAAMRGGITTVFDMPNTNPSTTSVEDFEEKVELFRNHCVTNFRLFLGAAPGIMDELPYLNRKYLAGVKLFWGSTTGSSSMPDPRELAILFRYCAKRGIVIMVHAEDNAVVKRHTDALCRRYNTTEKYIPIGEHRRIRDEEACFEASRQAIALAHRYGTRLHLAHVSTLKELMLLDGGPVESKQITAETTPLYLNERLAQKPTYRVKVNPAVKGAREARGLQEAVRLDLIDTLATDHAPHPLADKKRQTIAAKSGAPWVQFALPLLLETFEPEIIARKMALAPARLFGLEGLGLLRRGYHADFSLVKKVEEYNVSDDDVLSPYGWTPLRGLTLTHRVTLTHRANLER